MLAAGPEPAAAVASEAGSCMGVREQHRLAAWSWGLWDSGYLKKWHSAALCQQSQLCFEFH